MYNYDIYNCGVFRTIDKTIDDNFIVAGLYQCNDIEEQWKIMKFDQNGDSLWTTVSRKNTKYDSNWPYEIHQTFDGGYIVGGNLGPPLSYIMKLNEYGEVGIMDNGQFTIDNYELAQNYPNPFNNMTRIDYSLKSISDVKISVFNTQGQKVSELVNNKVGKGRHSVIFDGSRFNSGVYYYQLSIDGKMVDNRKMIYLK
ncbi:MAG: T9SS type A sorting domain-containing protein [Candidatus Delongbacteria bacterium]|nr:T9SS type A sorting domain-containing protein [Candidatus Delongbacteria bacterium]